MGKGYLNSAEKSIALTLAAFTAYLDDRIIEWTKISRPKDQVKYAKMAKSFTHKVLDFMFIGLDQDEVQKILKELGKMQVVTRYHSEAVKEYEAMKKIDSVTPVETQDLLDIVQLALASCSVCEEPGDDCKHKKLFIKYDMEPYNLSPGPGGCPYRIGPKLPAQEEQQPEVIDRLSEQDRRLVEKLTDDVVKKLEASGHKVEGKRRRKKKGADHETKD